MNTHIEFKSIADVRRHIVSILNNEIEEDIDMLIRSRQQAIPISVMDVYEEIGRFEDLIAYHERKIKEEEANAIIN